MNPPTKEKPCPTCGGCGLVSVPDTQAMIAARTARGITQAALAAAAGWKATYVSGLESGKRAMTQAAAERYWKALHGAGRKA